jgi:hypothetical protein
MKTRTRRAILAFVMLGIAISSAGCGSGGLYPVTGSLVYQGKPAAGASVHFHREGTTDQGGETFPIGIVDADGTFELETAGVGKGALPGRYKVLVRWPSDKTASLDSTSSKGSPSKHKDPKSDTDRLNYRYFQINNPLLTAEVKAENNRLEPFEIKD